MEKQSSVLYKLFCGWYVLQNLYPSFPISMIACSFITTLGQLEESLIIADRMYYLQKNGVHCQVDCIFDRSQSPRCMCITAVKEM